MSSRISSADLARKRFAVYIPQNEHRLCEHPMVTCRMRESASLGGLKTGGSQNGIMRRDSLYPTAEVGLAGATKPAASPQEPFQTRMMQTTYAPAG